MVAVASSAGPALEGLASGHDELAPLRGTMSGAGATPPMGAQNRRGRASKAEVADAFLANLRARGTIEVDADGFADAVREHFEKLPSRCAARPPPPPPRAPHAQPPSMHAHANPPSSRSAATRSM
jgi:hypothetical protein